jgi:hypothetical protein
LKDQALKRNSFGKLSRFLSKKRKRKGKKRNEKKV